MHHERAHFRAFLRAEGLHSMAAIDAPATSQLRPRIARAFESLQRPDSAIVAYEAYLRSTNPYQLPTDARELARTYKRLGELYEAKGDTKRAIQRYGDFVELWKDADAVLQPNVTAVRERITKLLRKSGLAPPLPCITLIAHA